jgi:hypothetical protein
LDGQEIHLEVLHEKEKDFLGRVLDLYRKPGVSWDEFSHRWLILGKEELWPESPPPRSHPVRLVCRDLSTRLGLLEERISPPSYRSRLAELIEEKFGSRAQFCRELSIDEAHLSRVLSGSKDFSLKTLERVLAMLGVRLDLVHREDEGLVRLQALEQRIAMLKEARAQCGQEGMHERSVPATPGMPRSEFEHLNREIQRGRQVEEVLQEALEEATEHRGELLLRLRAEGMQMLRSLEEPHLQAGACPVEPDLKAAEKQRLIQALDDFGFRKTAKERFPAECCYIFIRRDRVRVPLVWLLGRHLGLQLSVIEAGVPDYGSVIDGGAPGYGFVALLRTPDTARHEDEIRRFLHKHQGVYLRDEEAAKAFLASLNDDTASIGRFTILETIVQQIRGRELIRLQFAREDVLQPALARICESLKVAFSVPHACVIYHGFCDFIALDPSSLRPIRASSPRLAPLIEGSLAETHRIQEVHVIRRAEEFRSKGLWEDLDHLLTRDPALQRRLQEGYLQGGILREEALDFALSTFRRVGGGALQKQRT